MPDSIKTGPFRAHPQHKQQLQQPQQGQYFLDFGQKDFTLRECKECGLVYAPGMQQDEALHREHHASACADGDRPLNPKRRRVLLGTTATPLAPGQTKVVPHTLATRGSGWEDRGQEELGGTPWKGGSWMRAPCY